jgi:hypothetical protein
MQSEQSILHMIDTLIELRKQTLYYSCVNNQILRDKYTAKIDALLWVLEAPDEM